MKIGNSPEASAGPAKVERRPAARKPDAPLADAAAPAPSAQVAISSTAQLAAAGSDDGSFDAAKVQRISQAISEGKFTINASAIADRLVANAQELLDARANKH
ncbi:MAG: flagellar biosynthesis anti-sigma factor FlgM [Roseateles sp.]|uniref:flagellar biosynthesis anti-sigma factor FlgM n=1 Tax=Roseateles sp. TaxID=1971397 RepID=UPI0039EA2EB8